MSEQRTELPVGEVLGALEHGYHPQNPTQMHPADFIVKHFKLDGHKGLRDVRRSDPASVLAALLAESPEATAAAIEALLTSDEALAGLARGLESQGMGFDIDHPTARASMFAVGRTAVRSACRSLLSKAPKEDGDA